MKINLNKKYSPLITSDTRYYSVIGGRSSGKSYSVTTVLCLMLLEDDTKILFLRKTLTSAHLSIIPEFISKLEVLGIDKLFHITKTEIVNKSNGSVIYFRGITSSSSDNTANLKSLSGINCVCFDEFEEVTDETTFDRIDLSVRTMHKPNKIICVMNPSSKEHFFYKRFFEGYGVDGDFNGVKNNCTYIHTTYLDNLENINPSFIEQADLMKKNNPEKYKHVLLGSWLPKAEGVIFENWRVGDFIDGGIVLYGCDFGFSVDETTLTKVAIDKKQKKIYLHECVYKSGLTTSEINGLFKSYAGNRLIVADSAEPRLIEELRRSGLNIKGAVKGQGSVTAGIALMLDYELIVSPTSVNLIKELNNYVWHDKKSNTPIDAFNHAIDGARYAISDLLNGGKRPGGTLGKSMRMR